MLTRSPHFVSNSFPFSLGRTEPALFAGGGRKSWRTCGGVAVWANNIKPKELERRRRRRRRERRREEPDGQTDRQTRRRQRRGKVEEEMHNSFMRWPKGICIFHGTLSCYVVDRQGSWPKTDKRRTHKGSLLANDAHYGQSGVNLSLRVLRNGVDKISTSSNDCKSGIIPGVPKWVLDRNP